ncbi:Upstream activation factor subunit spp27 [Quillaja saponaria]|uniref:Upstream activation factor subunit spp27 n=1 Tax=Quillaja saponaria TaxID=32244 RepID=A0AAD7LZZ7_QUISA|nr:Upstream activation factor subunit spp27 [Quillaja saponaria]KAJ7967420.1 Upstream activation factor subunit spp27 [Quillaja saponaria]
MVSDSDIVTRLQEIISTSDLDTATVAIVRRQLENDFGVDLTDRKAFVRDRIDIFLQTLSDKSEEEEVEKEAGGDLENVKQKKNLEDENNDINEEEDEDDDDIGEKVSKNGGSHKVKTEVKKRSGGFSKPCGLSPNLQKIVGVPEMARTEVVKKLWAYIREKKLQDPKDKRKIRCDNSLHELFRVNCINMFQMNKALSKHIWPLSAAEENVKQQIKEEESDGSASEDVSNGNEQESEEEEEKQGESEEVESDGQQCKKIGSDKVNKDGKKRGGGFNKLCSLSPQLQTVIGVPALARTEVVKRLWTYIQENDLQDPKDKRKIICDGSLHDLFRVKSVNMFKMNKVLSKHIWPLNEEDEPPDEPSQKQKRSRQECEDFDEPKLKQKQQKKGVSGLLAPLQLSDALVKFFGTDESALSRDVVVKRMWDYIKQNNLQDPTDKMRVICDDKLKELFQIDSFHGFGVSKLLTVHLTKMELG